jgi:chromosome segregation ATPase
MTTQFSLVEPAMSSQQRNSHAPMQATDVPSMLPMPGTDDILDCRLSFAIQTIGWCREERRNVSKCLEAANKAHTSLASQYSSLYNFYGILNRQNTSLQNDINSLQAQLREQLFQRKALESKLHDKTNGSESVTQNLTSKHGGCRHAEQVKILERKTKELTEQLQSIEDAFRANNPSGHANAFWAALERGDIEISIRGDKMHKS